MESQKSRKYRLLRKHYAIPSEHGAWIWWLGPFIIGTFAAGGLAIATIPLFFAALFAFLLRQPLSILVKVWTGRRNKRDFYPSMFWTAVYGTGLILTVALLVGLGYPQLLLLVIPGIPVFIWHLWLIANRRERGQVGIELVGTGVLALAAPAAYWVSGGQDQILPWILWILTWLQSAASIVNVYDRLEVRVELEPTPLSERIRKGGRSLAYHLFNVGLSLILVIVGWIPWLTAFAFLLMLIDGIDTVLRPPMGKTARAIGFRQLAVSSLFVVLVSIGFLLT